MSKYSRRISSTRLRRNRTSLKKGQLINIYGMSKNKNEHILNASASLLGFSFLAVTALRTLNLIHKTRVDQFASFTVIVFTFSVIFSFLSIRSSNPIRDKNYETVAEYTFMVGLLSVLLLVILIEAKIV